MAIKKVFQRYDQSEKDIDQNNATTCLFCLERVWFNEWLYFNDNNGEPQKASYTHYWIIGDVFPVIHGDECKAIWGSDAEYEKCKEKRIQAINQGMPGVEIEIPYRPNEDQRYARFVEIGKYYSKEKEKRQNKQTTLFQGANEL